LGWRRSKIFFCEGLDDPNQLELAQEIRFYAHAVFAVASRVSDARSGKIGLICPWSDKTVVPPARRPARNNRQIYIKLKLELEIKLSNFPHRPFNLSVLWRLTGLLLDPRGVRAGRVWQTTVTCKNRAAAERNGAARSSGQTRQRSSNRERVEQ
jgi:hypothetical protein